MPLSLIDRLRKNNMKQAPEITIAVQDAFKLIQQKQYQQALTKLQPFTDSPHPDLHYLLGICYKSLAEWQSAITSLSDAAKLAPLKSEILTHLAKCYWLSGDLQQAEAHYLALYEAEPKNLDLLKNLSLLYLEQNQLDMASQWALKGQSLDDSGQLTKILGDVEKTRGNLSEAIGYYQQVPQHSPVVFRAIHNLGLCYKLQAKFNQAIQCFKFVHQKAPEHYEPLYNLGDCFFANGQFEQAQQAYNLALKQAPYNPIIHKAINELYWQSGQHQLFATSLLNVMESANNRLELIECLAELYWNTNQYRLCEECIQASGYADTSATLLALRGRLAATNNDLNAAFKHFDSANKIVINYDRICEQAKFAIQLGEFGTAQSLLEKVLQAQPNSQLALAWLSVVFQATDKQKHHALCNPDFILTTNLSAPGGYQDTEDFLKALESCLLTLHQGKQAPSEQTLVNGSQISGGLLNRDIEIISKARTQLLRDIDKCLNKLDLDPEHPFLAHLRKEKCITGSWSVKLTEQGFHVSHIHPAGWISVVLYINTPNDDSNNGVIEFGRPPLAPPYDFPPFKTVKPQRGQIVIFPSYFWHGTQPFNPTSNNYRMTLPFDIGVLNK